MIGSFIVTGSCITSHAEFFGKTLNHPGNSDPLQPRFGTLQLLAFPQNKITFEREESSDCRWDSEKYEGVADGDWENCVKSQSAYFKGDWVSLSYVQCFLCLVYSSTNVSIFHITWLDTFCTDLIILEYYSARGRWKSCHLWQHGLTRNIMLNEVRQAEKDKKTV